MSNATVREHDFDTTTAEGFAERTADLLNAGAISVMLSLGHRLGLFDTMATLPPATSSDIAGRAGLAERYTREWLAVMTVGGIVHYDPADRTYHLPAEHAAALTRDGALGNMAVYAQHVALMGAVQDRVEAAFRTGGGLDYDAFPHFHAIMAEDSDQTVLGQLFTSVIPLAAGLGDRLAQGIDVLDAGCGRGHCLTALARHYPASRFVGYDLCADAIAFAASAARRDGLDNLRFEARDLGGLDERERYDLITSFDAVHDQKDPADLLSRLHRALRPGGVYLMQDIGGSATLENNRDFPMAALLYAISCVHCTPVSLAQGGEGLGTMWGWETAEAMLHGAGFDPVERNVLPHDPMNVWFVARRQ